MSVVAKKFIYRPEIVPKHFDKLKTEPGWTRKARLDIQIRSGCRLLTMRLPFVTWQRSHCRASCAFGTWLTKIFNPVKFEITYNSSLSAVAASRDQRPHISPMSARECCTLHYCRYTHYTIAACCELEW